MSDKRAEELAREAIDTAVEGDETKARELAEQAKKIDPNAAANVRTEVEHEHEEATAYQERQKPDG